MIGPGGEQHVPTRRLGGHTRDLAGLVGPHGGVESLVPVGIGAEDLAGALQTKRSGEVGQPDPLHQPVLCLAGARVEQVPQPVSALTTDPVHVARSSKAGVLGGLEGPGHAPRPRGGRGGVADTGAEVALGRLAKSRGACKKNMWYLSPSSANQRSQTQVSAGRNTSAPPVGRARSPSSR